ncbi:MAG: hypothetical protein WBQ34_16230 [Candidatus Acidiferrales bacterium]
MRKAYISPVLVIALGLCFAALPSPASAQVAVGISVRVGPPALPVYAQPICPGAGYIWTPGYWAYGDDGYYWVPGTWVLAPEPGYLWTPGWWGFESGAYLWHPGYWGPHVGYYGGINYGYGYFGVGFVGGEWRGGHFFYNRAVMNVNVNVIHNVYVNRNYRVVTRGRVSYNGGPHGVNIRPTPQQQRWDSERHVGPTANQERHVTEARDNRALHYSDNHGRPPIAATQRPGEFSGRGVVHGGNQFHPPTNQNRPRQNYQPHPNNRENRPNQVAPRNQPNNRENRPNYQSPRNQPNERGNQRAQPRPQERQRNEAAPRGNAHREAHPQKEAPHGKEGGEHGDRGHDGGQH